MLELLLVPLLALGLGQDVNSSQEASKSAPEDARTVKELRQDLKKEKNAEQRGVILQLLMKRAASTPDDAKSAWESITAGLKDKSFVLRCEAVKLLMLAPDREIAVKSLTVALEKSLVEAAASRGRDRGRPSTGGRSALAGAFGSPPLTDKERAEAKERRAKAAEFEAREGYLADLITAVGSLPDDRSVKAMIRFFEQAPGRGLGRPQLQAAQALAQLGTHKALEAIRKSLEKVAELAVKEEERRERDGGRAPARGNDEGPTAQESAAGFHDALSAAARKAELSGSPEYEAQIARVWKKFLSKNSKAFPSKLGKIKPLEEDG